MGEAARRERSPEPADAGHGLGASREAARLDVSFDESDIDPDALKVVRHLLRRGFESYLVGGGVRDLLLGRRPKDFDVATGARPEKVRSLFRNSRIIGRRFRLVHVLFGGRKVIEVATFRRKPDGANVAGSRDETPRMASDNVFGDAHEDAARRDLTINALLYDVERKQVLDFVGGMRDIRERVVRTIGDPALRFREDPVRMLRAIKFCARLDLGMAPEVYDAIVLCRELITLSARPRLFEELLKLLRSGAARRSTWLAWETGLLHVLLPELGALLDDADAERGPAPRVWRLLGEVDRRTLQRGEPLADTVLLALLLLEAMREAVGTSRDRAASAHEFVEPIFVRLAVPRRICDAVCRIIAVMPRLMAGKPGRFARHELFPVASEVVSVDAAVAS